jgi:endonuclease/exonuclease/phosphatase family metal-dependent hydrolase
MRSIVSALLALAAAAAVGPARSPAPGADDTPPGVKVMTFNIQHGIDGSQRYHLQTAIDTIARINPDIVALQEVTRNHPFYNCDDQPKAIADALTKATGRQWTSVYHQQWFTPNKECVSSGRGDGPETEGVDFLAAEKMDAPKFIEGWNGGIGLATRTSRLPGVSIASTHLSAQAVNAPHREKQIAKLLPWLQSLGSPRIFVGDFNAYDDAPEMQPVFSAYRDAWADAVAAGTARGRLDGLTHGKHRIDYIFYVPGSRLQLLWAETVDTVPLVGKEASDHRPVVAGFAIK